MVWRWTSYRRARSRVWAACCAAAERKARSWTSNSRTRKKLSEIAPNGSFPTESGITASAWNRSTPDPRSAGKRSPSCSGEVVQTPSPLRTATDIGRSASTGKLSHPESPWAVWPTLPTRSMCVPVGVDEAHGAGVGAERRDGLVEQHVESTLGRDLLGERRGQRLQPRRQRQSAMAIADVAGDHRGADDLAVGSADRRDRQRDDDLTAVLGHPLGLVVLDPLAGEHLVEDPPLLAEPVGRDQDRDRATDRLVLRVAVGSLCAPGFQLVITPSVSLLRIASSEDSTIAANRSRAICGVSPRRGSGKPRSSPRRPAPERRPPRRRSRRRRSGRTARRGRADGGPATRGRARPRAGHGAPWRPRAAA